MDSTAVIKKERESGVELLKIIAIFLIIVCHYLQTAGRYCDLESSTTNPLQFLMSVLRYSGAIGNSIFMIATFYYLSGSKNKILKKALMMIFNIFLLSAICLLITISISGIDSISSEDVFISLTPTIHGNNGYVTNYLHFIFCFPIVRFLEGKMNRWVHLVIGLGTYTFFMLYGRLCLFDFWIWISIYLIVSYIKKYHNDWCYNRGLNIGVLLSCIGIVFLHIILINFVGLSNEKYAHKILFLTSYKQWLLWLIAFSSINLYRRLQFTNKFINRVSSFSMIIYLTHENILLRSHYRPIICDYFYNIFGESSMLFWILGLCLMTFLACACFSYIYQISIGRLVEVICRKITNAIYALVSRITKNKAIGEYVYVGF